MTRDTLDVGRVVKPHGLKGHVLVDLWSDRVERLAAGATLQSERGDLVVQSAARHQERFLVKFDRIDSREESERWRGVVLSAPRLEVPDALWIDELFDCEVLDQHGVRRGRVLEVEANPASDLLVLDSGALVPLVFVVRVEPNELVEINAPEGLFE